MPKPQDVNSKNFEVKKIIFDNGQFSVAYGSWKGTLETLAMRWNGDEEEDQGFPKTFGHPMWFIVHDELKAAIIKSIAEIDPSLLLQ